MSDLRLVYDHRHSHLTMASLRLSAIYPDWLGVLDCNDKLNRSGSSAQGLKAREEAAGERMAWIGKAALHNGVILWEVAEGQGVAN